MSEYVVRIERNGGSMNGEIVGIFTDLDEARDFIDLPPHGWVMRSYRSTT